MVFRSLAYFHCLKHLILLLKCNFFRAPFLHLITDTDSMQGHAAQIFFFLRKHLFKNANIKNNGHP